MFVWPAILGFGGLRVGWCVLVLFVWVDESGWAWWFLGFV